MDQKLGSVATIHREIGSHKRMSRPNKPSDPRVQQLIDHVIECGYVVIPDAFTKADIDEAKAEVARLTASPEAGPAAAKGRNPFEGLRTQRLYALPNKSRVFNKFALHPDILTLNDHFLDPGYLLNTLQSIVVLPGEKAQTLHYDDGFVNVPRPHHPFGTGVMVPLENYTSTNGATVVVPKSHTWDSNRVPQRSEAIPVVTPAGSIVFFLSTLYHGAGANTSTQNRPALTAQYCQPWIRPIENHILSVEWDKLDEIPPKLVDMFGYKVGPPFVGHVDGKNPRVALTRLLEKWKKHGDAKL